MLLGIFQQQYAARKYFAVLESVMPDMPNERTVVKESEEKLNESEEKLNESEEKTNESEKNLMS